MRYLALLPLLFLLIACGPSREEKQNIAIITCNIMEMDSSNRIKEINTARDKIGAKPYLFGDDKIEEAIEYGLCEELVLDNQYEKVLPIAKIIHQIDKANEAQLNVCQSLNNEMLNYVYVEPSGYGGIMKPSGYFSITINEKDTLAEKIRMLTYNEERLNEVIPDYLDPNLSYIKDSSRTEYEKTFKFVEEMNKKLKEQYEILNYQNTKQIYGEALKCDINETLKIYREKKSNIEEAIQKNSQEIAFLKEKLKEEEAEKIAKKKRVEEMKANGFCEIEVLATRSDNAVIVYADSEYALLELGDSYKTSKDSFKFERIYTHNDNEVYVLWENEKTGEKYGNGIGMNCE